MLRTLAFVEARSKFHLVPAYINTKYNHIADDLSRNKLSSFFSKVPQASPSPSSIPQDLLALLLDQSAEWLSPTWTRLFNDTFKKDWPSQPSARMELH